MPVPTVITDLSTTAASNSPAGSDPPGPDGDNYFRAHAAFIRQLYNGTTSVSAGMLKSTGTSIAAATADVDYQSALTAASQAEMEAGTESAVRKMSPLRVAQAIAALGGVDQIQEFSASVGSNALTISCGAVSLDFRSATLGSGTITRVSGTPANLVISSGSTLGSVSGQECRLVVVAMNNSGTLELAVSNLTGALDISEAGLISTTAEGGAGGADSASVWYSTTARTSLPYRLIGFIDATEATAGTWATAPSLIQGAGGQAAAFSGFGFGQSWQSVTRSSGSTYYNDTGKPIELRVYAQVTTAGGGSITITINGFAMTLGGGTTSEIFNGSITIPAGATYAITHSNILNAAYSELR